MKDLYNSISAAQVLAPISISATQSAVEVDLKDCNSAVFLWATGAEAGTLSGSLGWSLTMTHADDNGSGAADAGKYSNARVGQIPPCWIGAHVGTARVAVRSTAQSPGRRPAL